MTMRSLGRSCGSSKTSPTSNRPELPKTFPRERSQLPLRRFEGPMCNGQFPRGATRDGFTMIELVIGIVGRRARPMDRHAVYNMPGSRQARAIRRLPDTSARGFSGDLRRANRQRHHSTKATQSRGA
jgi:hypothetical protein